MATDTSMPDTASLPPLLTVPQLAQYLDVPISTLYLWRTKGAGPTGLKVGKQVRYRASDVAAWLEEQQTRSESP